MKTEPLSLAHKELLYDKLKRTGERLSEFSFANLFLFRNVHNYQVHFTDTCLYISGKTYDRKDFVLPLCDSAEPDIEHLDSLMGQYGMLYPIPEEWLSCFPEEKYLLTHCKNDSDYIYTTEKMATYAGRKLHKKRNLLKQFREAHPANAEILNIDTRDDAKQIVEQWQEEINQPREETDYAACLEALHYISELHLEGYIYYIDEHPAGFILGEAITPDTFALHFAKGLTQYKGIYQFLYNDFALKVQDRFAFLNFEQDLGKQSLRQAKSSYLPDHMADKYRVELRK